MKRKGTVRKYNDPKAAAGGSGRTGPGSTKPTAFVCAADLTSIDKSIISQFTEIVGVLSQSSALELLVRKTRPNFLIIDVAYFSDTGFDLCAFAVRDLPKTQVVVWSELTFLVEHFDRLTDLGIKNICERKEESEGLGIALIVLSHGSEDQFIDPNVWFPVWRKGIADTDSMEPGMDRFIARMNATYRKLW